MKNQNSLKDFIKIKKFVINLNDREDRLEHFKKEMEKINSLFEVVEAYHHDDGFVGCVLSHIKCLDLAIKRDYDKIIIFEDDFTFHTGRIGLINLDADYDVFLLGGHITNAHPVGKSFQRIIQSERTEGYIVKKHFYKLLRENFIDGLSAYLKKPVHQNHLDIYWNKLQKENLFYSNDFGLIGYQFPSYSDITNSFQRSHT